MSDFPIEWPVKNKVAAAAATAVLLVGCSVATSAPPEPEESTGCIAGQHVYFHCATGPASFAALCGTADGQVLYRAASATSGDSLIIRNGVDAQFRYNRFTRPRATHEEVSFEFQDQRYTVFRYYDADLGKPRTGLLTADADLEREGVDRCMSDPVSHLAPLAGMLPCDAESALGCP